MENIELKPCPFCGGHAELYSMKRDKRKVFGVYHMIAEIRCHGVLGCTVRVSQAGYDEKKAFENAASVWNRRADNEQKEVIANNATTTGEWISVEDRLPEKEDDYLVYTTSGFIEIDRFSVPEDEDVDGCWWELDGYVTHWMPFPEAPKMKGGEADA